MTLPDGSANAADRPSGRSYWSAWTGRPPFDARRLLGEPAPLDRPDPIERTLASMLPDGLVTAAVVLAAGWRAALLSVAAGTPRETARAALEFTLAG